MAAAAACTPRSPIVRSPARLEQLLLCGVLPASQPASSGQGQQLAPRRGEGAPHIPSHLGLAGACPPRPKGGSIFGRAGEHRLAS